MKTPVFSKLLFLVAMALSLSACMGKQLGVTEANHNVNYGGYLAATADCFRDNNHEISFIPQGATAPVEMKLKAGGCADIEKPQHGGEYVAQVQTAYIQAGGQVLAAGINAAVNYEISQDNNDTRVRIAELQNEREAAENAVLVEAIGSNDAQNEALTALGVAVTEQNAALTELVANLTGDETEGGETEGETETETDDGGV